MSDPDPFETTLQDRRDLSSSQSSPLPPPKSSLLSTVGAIVIQAGALWQIGTAWSDGRIPVAWHAIVAIVLVTLPSDSLTELGKGAIRAWARRKDR